MRGPCRHLIAKQPAGSAHGIEYGDGWDQVQLGHHLPSRPRPIAPGDQHLQAWKEGEAGPSFKAGCDCGATGRPCRAGCGGAAASRQLPAALHPIPTGQRTGPVASTATETRGNFATSEKTRAPETKSSPLTISRSTQMLRPAQKRPSISMPSMEEDRELLMLTDSASRRAEMAMGE